VQSINYTVETVGGTVYLMGIGQNQHELDRAINHARTTKYVKNVVSYVRLRGEPAAGVADTPVTGQQPLQDDSYAPTPLAAPNDAVESVPIDDMTGSY
jgi:hypothetical protein